MKSPFDPVPLRKPLVAWTNSASATQHLRSAVDKSGSGSSTANPAEVPPDLAQKPAVERCEWALAQVAQEQKTVSDARDEQSRAGILREWLQRLQAEKRAQESTRARKRLKQMVSTTAVVLFVLGAVALRWWQHRPPRIPTAAVEQALARPLSDRGLSLSGISLAVDAAQNGIATIRATFTAKNDRPLYTTVATEPYLRGDLKLDPGASRRIAELTAGKGQGRVLELAGLSGAAFDAAKVTLLKVVNPAGTTFSGAAFLRASRSISGWTLSEPSMSLPALRSDLRPRSAFAANSFEIDREEDRTRLRALVNDQPNIVARLERARDAYATEVLAVHRQQEETLVGVFRAGSIFAGTTSGRNPNDKKPIFFEITEAAGAGGAGAHNLKALFHNDGGWGDGRIFEGTWKFDTGQDRFALSLASGSDQAIRAGGPVLGDFRLLKIDLAIEEERLAGQLDSITWQLARVPDADREKVKREASPDYFGMRDVIAPDSIYVGSVKITEANTQQIVLRFARVENSGAVVEAVLHDPEREAWQYKLTGSLIGNRYREATWPLRLAVIRNAIPPGIPPRSFVLQFPALALRLENGRLIGDYRGQPFFFEPLSRAESARQLQATAARRKTFDRALQPGTVIDGLTVSPQKNLRSPLRLRMLAFNSADGSITARLESGQTPGLFRNLTGNAFVDAGVLNLAFDIRPNEYNVDRRAPEPFFKGGRDNLVLTLEDLALTGQDGHTWTFEFSLDPNRPGRAGN